MNDKRWREVERVVDVVLETDPTEWPRIIEERCASDPELRREVEALLSRYQTARRYLDSPPVVVAAALVEEGRGARYTREGSRIGAYRLVRQIGRGGTALVFLAERDDGQFRQQVALKVLRPGHDSDIDQVRFRSERQILASLSHPNIARLLDGGVTDDGLPYLVIELIDGKPIDQYCEAGNLTLRQRLEMFLTVIEATQYAHRNLVVHRDLKPSNILVTNDGQVKLLDFGLAKLLDPGMSTRDFTTQRWMTPEYAAPEQVRGETATTLTDVYQLGVVLYQLLTGRLPFGTRHERPHELERAILDVEPAAPSSPDQRALRGDLDAIVLKAVRKEPEQRYRSAQEMADDIGRHLSGHAVLARRQTAGYRARRFARRHRWGLAAASAAIILAGAYVVTMNLQRARVERALSEAELEAQKAQQVTDLMLSLFEASEGGQAFRDTVTARELLRRGVARAQELTGQPLVRAQVLDVIGQMHSELTDHTQARTLFEEALALRRDALGGHHPDVAATLHNLGNVSYGQGQFADAGRLYREALAIRRASLGPSHLETLETLYWLGNALHEAGDVRAARPVFDEWIAAITVQPPVLTVQRWDALVRVGQMVFIRGDNEAAERLFRQALMTRKALFGPRHPSVGAALHYVGSALREQGKHAESESALREAVDVLRTAYPEGNRELAQTVRALALTLHRAGRLDEAAAAYAEAQTMHRRLGGDDYFAVGTGDDDLGRLYRQRGDFARAEPHLREAVRIYRVRFDDENLLVAHARITLGDVLRERGKLTEAESLLVGGYAVIRGRRMPGLRLRYDSLALASLVKLYQAQGREGEASRYRTLLDSLLRG
ncbi:MAG TPA: serine/threonine-protein kinase [Gemmatimonadaceae bacterium]|nr:serine/threonine-protein kinase [Gemmatimonadaceae bacterium]